MEPLGKKTERFWLPAQVRTDGPVAAEIRLSHQEDGRGRLQDQITFLLTMGLEYRRQLIRNGQWHPIARVVSQGSTSNFRREDSANTKADKTSQVGTDLTQPLPGQLLLPGTAGPISARRRKQVA